MHLGEIFTNSAFALSPISHKLPTMIVAAAACLHPVLCESVCMNHAHAREAR